MIMKSQEKYADKIAKLLRHAEKAGTQEEAETFVQKAQELMTQYAISEQLVNQARGENEKTQEEIVQRKIILTGIFKDALMSIAYVVVKANDCRGVTWKREASKAEPNWRKTPITVAGVEYAPGEMLPKLSAGVILEITGFESDVARVVMLNSSVQIQAASAQLKWWKLRKDEMSWMSGMDKFKERREFLYGFSTGLRTQLRDARVKGREAARAAEEARLKDNGTAAATAVQESSDSVSLVVASKKKRVDDYVDKSYGRLRSSSNRRSTGSYGAKDAGRSAGRSADAGSSGRVSGGRKQLGQ